MALYLGKPPRTLGDRDEELYRWLCRTVDDLNAVTARLETRLKAVGDEVGEQPKAAGANKPPTVWEEIAAIRAEIDG